MAPESNMRLALASMLIEKMGEVTKEDAVATAKEFAEWVSEPVKDTNVTNLEVIQ